MEGEIVVDCVGEVQQWNQLSLLPQVSKNKLIQAKRENLLG